ncbi:MAG: hypothetical protein V4502_03910 [Pseudomonadota bacterium]
MSWLRDRYEFRGAMWNAHPRWAKVYLYIIGVPSWLFLAIHQFAADDPLKFGAAEKVALGLFVSAVVVQMAVLFRAFWRMDV